MVVVFPFAGIHSGVVEDARRIRSGGAATYKLCVFWTTASRTRSSGSRVHKSIKGKSPPSMYPAGWERYEKGLGIWQKADWVVHSW